MQAHNLRVLRVDAQKQKVLLAQVSILGPLGYEPNTLPLRQRADELANVTRVVFCTQQSTDLEVRQSSESLASDGKNLFGPFVYIAAVVDNSFGERILSMGVVVENMVLGSCSSKLPVLV